MKLFCFWQMKSHTNFVNGVGDGKHNGFLTDMYAFGKTLVEVYGGSVHHLQGRQGNRSQIPGKPTHCRVLGGLENRHKFTLLPVAPLSTRGDEVIARFRCSHRSNHFQFRTTAMFRHLPRPHSSHLLRISFAFCRLGGAPEPRDDRQAYSPLGYR